VIAGIVIALLAAAALAAFATQGFGGTATSTIGQPVSAGGPFAGPIDGFDSVPGTLARPNLKIADTSTIVVDTDIYGRWADAMGVTASPYKLVLFAGQNAMDGSASFVGRVIRDGSPTGAVHMFCGFEMALEANGGMWTCLVHDLAIAHQILATGDGSPATEAEDIEAWAVATVVEAYEKGCEGYACYTRLVADNARTIGLALKPLPERSDKSLDYVTVLGWAREIGNPVR
jgi:hypothetical protein